MSSTTFNQTQFAFSILNAVGGTVVVIAGLVLKYKFLRIRHVEDEEAQIANREEDGLELAELPHSAAAGRDGRNGEDAGRQVETDGAVDARLEIEDG